MWAAIQWVTGTTTLIAFAIAVVASVLRARIRRDVDVIQAAPEAERTEMASVVLERLALDTSKLNPAQTFKLAMATLEGRLKRLAVILVAIVLFAAVSAAALVYALARKSGPTVDSQTWFRGTLMDPHNNYVPHAQVLLVGTACTTETNASGYFDFSSCVRQPLQAPRIDVRLEGGLTCRDVPLRSEISEVLLGMDDCQDKTATVGGSAGNMGPVRYQTYGQAGSANPHTESGSAVSR